MFSYVRSDAPLDQTKKPAGRCGGLDAGDGADDATSAFRQPDAHGETAADVGGPAAKSSRRMSP
jgi:hypothetical protein